MSISGKSREESRPPRPEPGEPGGQPGIIRPDPLSSTEGQPSPAGSTRPAPERSPAMRTDSPFLRLAEDRVVILDGGMGTSLHRYKPTTADWGYAPDGKSLMNLSDALVYTHPEWIREIHAGFFAAGCDAVETNTFNANGIGLGEFGLADKLDEINRLNIRLAREVAAGFSTPDR